MNLKNIVGFVAALCVAGTSSTAYAQLQLECQTDINALYLLKDANSLDLMIYGVKVRDWKKEYLDQVLANAEECVEKKWSNPDQKGITTKAMIDDLRVNAYPRWLSDIDERDRNLQKELAVAAEVQKVAEERQHENELRQQREIEAQQKQIEQAKRNAEAETERRAEVKKTNNLWILGITIAVAFSGWIWNRFIRNRCPSCKSTGCDTVNVTETDRFRGTKEVTETHSRGINTRHVQVTYVTKLYRFHCKTCHQEWEKERREELGGNLIMTRIRSGFF